jgi:hypothetical protein
MSVGVGERKFGAEGSSRAVRAMEPEPAAERLDPVLEPDQASAAGKAGAPAAVVANRYSQGAGAGLDADGS